MLQLRKQITNNADYAFLIFSRSLSKYSAFTNDSNSEKMSTSLSTCYITVKILHLLFPKWPMKGQHVTVMLIFFSSIEHINLSFFFFFNPALNSINWVDNLH